MKDIITIGCDPATENTTQVIKHTENGMEVLQVNGESFSDYYNRTTKKILESFGISKEQLVEPIDEKFRSGAVGAKKMKQYMTEIDLMRNHYFPNWKSLVDKIFDEIIDEEQNSIIGLA